MSEKPFYLCPALHSRICTLLTPVPRSRGKFVSFFAQISRFRCALVHVLHAQSLFYLKAIYTSFAQVFFICMLFFRGCHASPICLYAVHGGSAKFLFICTLLTRVQRSFFWFVCYLFGSCIDSTHLYAICAGPTQILCMCMLFTQFSRMFHEFVNWLRGSCTGLAHVSTIYADLAQIPPFERHSRMFAQV